jgi:integrase
MDGRSYLRRFLKPLAKSLGIQGLTFQSLRRTFATQVHKLGTVKDAQAQLRHAHASTTLDVYTQEIPDSVRQTVEALDREFFGTVTSGKVN